MNQFYVVYDKHKHGWVVAGLKHKSVFVTKMAAENFCKKKTGMWPMSAPAASKAQELPQNSVWTGAPWDRAFKNLR